VLIEFVLRPIKQRAFWTGVGGEPEVPPPTPSGASGEPIESGARFLKKIPFGPANKNVGHPCPTVSMFYTFHYFAIQFLTNYDYNSQQHYLYILTAKL